MTRTPSAWSAWALNDAMVTSCVASAAAVHVLEPCAFLWRHSACVLVRALTVWFGFWEGRGDALSYGCDASVLLGRWRERGSGRAVCVCVCVCACLDGCWHPCLVIRNSCVRLVVACGPYAPPRGRCRRTPYTRLLDADGVVLPGAVWLVGPGRPAVAMSCACASGKCIGEARRPHVGTWAWRPSHALRQQQAI